jgi:hypothetical protein
MENPGAVHSQIEYWKNDFSINKFIEKTVEIF